MTLATIQRGESFSYTLDNRLAGDVLTAALKPANNGVKIPQIGRAHV